MIASIDYPVVPIGTYHEQKDGMHLLLHPFLPRWAVVNTTGWAVFQLCDGHHSIPDIVMAVAQRWQIDEKIVRPDVDACLIALQRSGFLSQKKQEADQSKPEAQKPKDWQAQINLTEQCNLSCRHCAVHSGPAKKQMLPVSNLYPLVDQAVRGGATSLNFSGGEPLLIDGMLDLLQYSAGQVSTALATNATLIDSPTADRLAVMGAYVQISLDGCDPVSHNNIRGKQAFERAWQGIKAMLERGMEDRLRLNVTLMRHNIDHVPEFLSLAAENNVKRISFSLLEPAGRASQHWNELVPSKEQIRKAFHYLYLEHQADGMLISKGLGLQFDPPDQGLWCRLGRTIWIDASGDLYPCGPFTTPEYHLGNIKDTALTTAMASQRLTSLVARCEQRIEEIEACRACAWRHFCRGACSGRARLRQGTIHATDEYCGLRQELYREIIFAHAARKSTMSYLDGCQTI